ncbi:uncharacterized protein C6orf136 [Caerostris extrusa]|uniref:Uncharacterized protein C6orf136 n=1 Tax=Caerostris extrusa TaxID=172846 RepID=A0AAV4YAS3_CAEEX|nr:uncharacterized protein C6orf136 [Caerostris extrusa]
MSGHCVGRLLFLIIMITARLLRSGLQSHAEIVMHSVCSVSTIIRVFNQIHRVKWIQGHHIYFHLIKEVTRPLCCSLSRIICTDARLQNAVSHKIQTDHRNDFDHASFDLPVLFVKDNYKAVDHYYLKQVLVPKEICNVDELIRTVEFKKFSANPSFHYNVNLAQNYGNYLPSSSIYYYSFEDIYRNSISHVKHSETLKITDKVFAKSDSNVESSNTGKPSEGQLLLVIDRLTSSLLNFFEKPLDYSIYHKNIIFQNNINGVVIKGLSAYIQTMYVLKIYGYLQYAKVKVEILKITHHIEDGTVRVPDWLDGFSVFSVGPDGLIYKHVCDKMTPSDDTVKSKKADLKSKILGLLDLPRPSAAGSLHTLVPCYRSQDFFNNKKLS